MPVGIAQNTGSRDGTLVTEAGLLSSQIEYGISSAITRGYLGLNWYSPINPGNNQIVVISTTRTYDPGTFNPYPASTPAFWVMGTSPIDLLGTSTSSPTYTGSFNRLRTVIATGTKYTDVGKAFSDVTQNQQYMIVNFTYPDIETSGLIGALDAGFYASYPNITNNSTTANRWFNIAGGPVSSSGLLNDFLYSTEAATESPYIATGNSGSITFNTSSGYRPFILIENEVFERCFDNSGGTIILWSYRNDDNLLNIGDRKYIFTNNTSSNPNNNTGLIPISFYMEKTGSNSSDIAWYVRAGRSSSNPLQIGGYSSGYMAPNGWMMNAFTWDCPGGVLQYDDFNGFSIAPLTDFGSANNLNEYNLTPDTGITLSFNTIKGGIVGGYSSNPVFGNITGSFANGRIGAIYFYNRKFTNQEIGSFYDSTKVKYS